MTAIVSDDGIRSGRPRIEGTRIAVLDVKERVIEEEQDPHVVAGEYELSMAELFAALAHYYEHRESFERIEREREAVRRKGDRRTRERLDRVGPVGGDSGERPHLSRKT